MKKCMLLVIALLLCMAMFTSCGDPTIPTDTVPSDSSDSHAASVPAGSSPTDDSPSTDDQPSADFSSPTIERYTFFSIEDFKLYCTTGSKDASLYQKPPKYGSFPLYNMVEGCFVELSQLFPELDMNCITVDNVEVEFNDRYTYSGYTNTGNTPFYVSIRYKRNTDDVLSGIADEIDSKPTQYRIIYDDYYYGKDTAASEKTKGVVYVSELSGCTIEYNVYDGKIQGMSVEYGDYVIGISPAYSDNIAFFTDEALSPLSCLFKNGNDREQALNQIALFVNAKE